MKRVSVLLGFLSVGTMQLWASDTSTNMCHLGDKYSFAYEETHQGYQYVIKDEHDEVLASSNNVQTILEKCNPDRKQLKQVMLQQAVCLEEQNKINKKLVVLNEKVLDGYAKLKKVTEQLLQEQNAHCIHRINYTIDLKELTWHENRLVLMRMLDFGMTLGCLYFAYLGW